MINALLFISVCLNILAGMIIGVLVGKAERRKAKTPMEQMLEGAIADTFKKASEKIKEAFPGTKKG
jgi:hypothetical protein